MSKYEARLGIVEKKKKIRFSTGYVSEQRNAKSTRDPLDNVPLLPDLDETGLIIARPDHTRIIGRERKGGKNIGRRIQQRENVLVRRPNMERHRTTLENHYKAFNLIRLRETHGRR